MKLTRMMCGTCLLVLLAVSVSTIQETGVAFAEEKGEKRGKKGAKKNRDGRGRDRMGRMGRMGRMFGKTLYLTSDQVRSYLNVTDEQGQKIDEILTAFREEARSLWRGGGGRGSDLSDEERRARREEHRKKLTELRKAIEGKIGATLDEAQNKRLNEIALQHSGVDGLNADAVATALALTDDQRLSIKEAVKAMHKEIRSTWRGRRDLDQSERQARREKVEQLRADTRSTILAMLTEEQSKKFDELQGAPFDLDRSTLRGGKFGKGGKSGKGGKGKRKRPEIEDAI